MIDMQEPQQSPIKEHLMTLEEAAKHLASQPTISTLNRWCHKGCRGVKLEYTREGHRIVVSLAAIQRFRARLRELDGKEERRTRVLASQDRNDNLVADKAGIV